MTSEDECSFSLVYVYLFCFVVFKSYTLFLGHFHTQPVSSHKPPKLRALGVRFTRSTKHQAIGGLIHFYETGFIPCYNVCDVVNEVLS